MATTAGEFRLLFNYQYNSRLTKLDDKVATASEYKDTGVKIVEFNGEKYEKTRTPTIKREEIIICKIFIGTSLKLTLVDKLEFTYLF